MEKQCLQTAYDRAIEKIIRNHKNIGVSFPHVAIEEGGIYNREPADFWTGGFWGGLLWMAYRETKKITLYETACAIEQEQDAILNEFVHLHHDVGFMWLPTAVMHHREDGNKSSLIRGLRAASLLAGRFNLAGRFIRAWNEEVQENSQGIAIIDCLMNLPLLYWAARMTNDPRFCHIAKAHADTVLETFMREDGTVPHMVRFDPETGEKIENLGGQGKGPDSVWSRGQAWAIYGFAVSYRETGELRYLEAAKKCARWFMEHLPENQIPYWDFSAGEEERFAKDASAACCAASGMLEIWKVLGNNGQGKDFRDMAVRLLEALTKECACFDDQTQAIIRYGTVSYPHNRHVNVPIIYGDFFYVEALSKLKGQEGIF